MKKWSVPLVTMDLYVGALSPDQAHASMFTPEYQRMDVLEIDDESRALLYSLMGPDAEPRRDYVFSNIDFSTIRE